MSPSLLSRGPLLSSNVAIGRAQYGPFAQTPPPPYRPDYTAQLPPSYDYTQQQSGLDGYGMHASYLGQTHSMAQQLGYNAANLADLSGLSSASAQSLQLPLSQYIQQPDSLHMPYRPALHSSQALNPPQPDTYYSQALPLPGVAAFPYSQAYPSTPSGGSFFS